MTVSSDGLLSEVFDRYRPGGTALFDLTELASGRVEDRIAPADEVLDESGSPRPAWHELVGGYERRGRARLAAAADRLAAAVRDDGVVYNEFDGLDTVSRDWRIDPVPLVIDGAEWERVERAVAQRSQLLDALMRDIYRDQKTLSAGLVPPEMVFGHPGYVRKAARLEVAGPHALFLHAVDLVRGPDGRIVAHADRTQAPSGIGYATIDRRLLSRTFPQLFQMCAPRPTTSFAGMLRVALTEYAPPGVDDPTVAVLSPGSVSETAFDQAYLASTLGVPLVEGSDLTVRDGAVYMRSLGKFKRVDVLLRRIDADYADPLDLRTDSRLGVAGLVEAISRGTVTVLNTLGSGVVENPALHTVLERVAPVLIDEELALPSVPTWWAGDDRDRSKIVADVAAMVHTNFRTGEEFVGPLLDRATRTSLAERISAEQWPWVARPAETWSVAPTMTQGTPAVPRGAVRPASVSVRAFSVAQGRGYAVMPGGLGSVLVDGPEGSALHAVAAKDVWVTSAEVGGHVSRVSETRTDASTSADGRVPSVSTPGRSDIAAVASPRVLSDLFWLGRYGERTELSTRMVSVTRERFADVQYRPWMSGGAAVPLVLDAVGQVTGTSAYLRTDELTGEVGAEREAGDTDQVDAASEVDRARPTSGAGPETVRRDIAWLREPAQVARAMTIIADLTVARSVAGTIAHSADRLSSAARTVRDQMSTSTWMVLTPMSRALTDMTRAVIDARGSADPDGAIVELGDDLGRTHDAILHVTLALAGLQAESMVHDAGWQFMDVGRRIERLVTLADLTRHLFGRRHDADVEQVLIEIFLVANESSVIYRRRNRGLYQVSAATELLFFDEHNPRALIYQLTRIAADLTALPESVRSASAERAVEELIAEVRRSDPADLARSDASGRRGDLIDLTSTLAAGIRELSDLLGRTRFSTPAAARPLWAGGSGIAP
ncbi:circularly permuted type 2 ATP-grasp protein [Gordonia soli]|uniref:Uncharacterized protein n=1 Tax=Gordonia soli NBRC 108243 TaxID=1223545 RepID=M0QJU0_9ACTN|nr:circularly permuted type 2 ATP-grasp protein [Gordonia soli]GAC68818.1 hypothetical protein GS4_19_00080 [Gordonia soli NBRC 108243]